jgi:chaperonin cofactor prefoldin
MEDNLIEYIKKEINYINELGRNTFVKWNKLTHFLDSIYPLRSKFKNNEKIVLIILETIIKNKDIYTEEVYKNYYNKFYILQYKFKNEELIPFYDEIERLNEDIEKLKEDNKFYKNQFELFYKKYDLVKSMNLKENNNIKLVCLIDDFYKIKEENKELKNQIEKIFFKYMINKK